MNIFVDSHQQLLKSLLQHKVNFLLVGGYAVVYHGYKRTTGDMDLIVSKGLPVFYDIDEVV